MKHFLNTYIRDFFEEFVAPAHCVVCGKKLYDSFICNDCASKIEYNKYPLIFHKDMIYYFGMTNYTGVIKTVITKFKFQNYKVIAKFLSEQIIQFTEKQNIHFETIGYVPMTKREESERGYNQTYLIAKEIARKTNKPIFKGLYKIRETERQSKLSKQERETNIKNAFRVDANLNKDILIVDDVFTTGSTAKEICDTISKRNKNNLIYFIAIARALE
ncbi:MAG: ComF family protein [Caldisericaceae bacterium]